jgi:hypothetical protein
VIRYITRVYTQTENYGDGYCLLIFISSYRRGNLHISKYPLRILELQGTGMYWYTALTSPVGRSVVYCRGGAALFNTVLIFQSRPRNPPHIISSLLYVYLYLILVLRRSSPHFHLCLFMTSVLKLNSEVSWFKLLTIITKKRLTYTFCKLIISL